MKKIPQSIPFDRVVNKVRTARIHQEKFDFVALQASHRLKLPFLAEEFREVLKEVNKLPRRPVRAEETRLRIALIHVAAVAVAWLESMEDPCG